MADLKTKQTEASVEKYPATIEDPRRRADCATMSALMKKVTKFEPRMWGPSIVGFGSYHYRYETGHEGDACLIGFSSRKPEIVVYIAETFESREELLQQLGGHRMGKACLYKTAFGHRRRSAREARQSVRSRGAKAIPVVRATADCSFERARWTPAVPLRGAAVVPRRSATDPSGAR